MRKRKLILLVTSIIMSICLLSGCGNSSTPDLPEEPDASNVSDTLEPTQETDTSTPEATDSIEETNTSATDENNSEFSFADISNLEFYFSSGAGGWATILTVHEDGTFEGIYSDSDMGVTGKDYPNGTCYYSDFSGKFIESEKVAAYTYSMKISNLKLANEPKTEEIKDGIKYVYSEPYGLDDAKEILIYTPGIALKDLPEEYVDWVGMSAGIDDSTTILPFYGLYNVNAQEGFSSYEKEDTSSAAEATSTSAIDDELAKVEEEAADLEYKLENEDMAQQDMNQTASELYQLWDDELNSIWSQLKNTLDSDTMDTLTTEEKEWITYKEEEIKKASDDFEGGSMQPLLESEKGAELTKARVYVLADYLK